MTGRIKCAKEQIPVMGFIDLASVSEDDLCIVKYRPKNICVKPNSPEEHSISAEIEIEIFCRVFGNKEMDTICDMYSPSRNLTFDQNDVSTMVNMQNTRDTFNIREKISLRDASEYDRICDVSVMPVLTEKNIQNNAVSFSGDLNLKFVLEGSDETNVMVQDISVPFAFNQDIQGLTKDSKANIELSIASSEFVRDGSDVSVKVDLQVNTVSYNIETIGVISNVDETEGGDDNPYSMVIYFVKSGDTLWKIAKKYKSTVGDIVRINNIENPDKISVGMQLFIPKCTVCAR